MSIRVDTFTLNVGDVQDLEVAQGEARRYQMTWNQGGSPINFTGWQDLILAIKDNQGIELVSRACDQQPPSGTTPSFTLGQADTVSQPVEDYKVDIWGIDGNGLPVQLMASSRMSVLEAVWQPGDTVTMPPALPGNPSQWATPVPATLQSEIDRMANAVYYRVLDQMPLVLNLGTALWADPQPATTQAKVDRLAAVIYSDVLDGAQISTSTDYLMSSPAPLVPQAMIDRIAWILYSTILDGNPIP